MNIKCSDLGGICGFLGPRRLLRVFSTYVKADFDENKKRLFATLTLVQLLNALNLKSEDYQNIVSRSKKVIYCEDVEQVRGVAVAFFTEAQTFVQLKASATSELREVEAQVKLPSIKSSLRYCIDFIEHPTYVVSRAHEQDLGHHVQLLGNKLSQSLMLYFQIHTTIAGTVASLYSNAARTYGSQNETFFIREYNKCVATSPKHTIVSSKEARLPLETTHEVFKNVFLQGRLDGFYVDDDNTFIPVEIKHRTGAFIGLEAPMYEIAQIMAYSVSLKSNLILFEAQRSRNAYLHAKTVVRFDENVWNDILKRLRTFCSLVHKFTTDEFFRSSFNAAEFASKEKLLYSWINLN